MQSSVPELVQILVSINNPSSSVTNIMDFTKKTEIHPFAFACNHCGILCISVEFHTISPTLLSRLAYNA